MACVTQTALPNHNTHYLYGNHNVAHDPQLNFYDHDQTEAKLVNTHHSNNIESMDRQLPKVKECSYANHHFIPTQIFLLVLFIFVAFNFSLCSCGNDCGPHYTLTADEEISISNDVAAVNINRDSSLMALSASDDTCGVTDTSSCNHAHNELDLGDTDAPPLALFGVDWEMLALSLLIQNSDFYPEYTLKPAGTELILHPAYNQPLRCKRLGPTLDDHRCSKLDDTLLSQCTPDDHDDQDSNKSSSFCPLQNSNYLHLYTQYTMMSTMKGLLLSDDIISIIAHQKMLQIQPKYFPLIFWLMVIGLTFSYFHTSGQVSYDDISHRLGGIQRLSRSSVNTSGRQSTQCHDSEIGCVDSDSSLSYHTASISEQTVSLNCNGGNHGDHLIFDTTNESELSDSELQFPAPIPAASMTNDFAESSTYTEAYARNVHTLNRPFLSSFIDQFGGDIPSPDSIILVEDYQPPIQES